MRSLACLPAYEDRSIAFTRIGQMRVRKRTQDEAAERAAISVAALQDRVAEHPQVVTRYAAR